MDILGVVIGAVISIIITIIFEKLKKPKLSFRIEDPPIIINYTNAQVKKAKFLRVQLWNNELNLLNRETAMHCNATIQILHLVDYAPIFRDEIPARWAGSDEPFSYQFNPIENGIVRMFDPSKYNAAFRRDCHPGTKETIDVVARFDNDEECYVWNNDYPIKGWKNPEMKISKGRYYVIVTVNSAGEKIKGFFKLENSASMNNFRLIAVNKKERNLLTKNT